jgi:hypothetical protein
LPQDPVQSLHVHPQQSSVAFGLFEPEAAYPTAAMAVMTSTRNAIFDFFIVGFI